MAYRVSNRNQFGKVNYDCDNFSDLNDIAPLIGGEAYIVNTGEKYMANSTGQWVIVPSCD